MLFALTRVTDNPYNHPRLPIQALRERPSTPEAPAEGEVEPLSQLLPHEGDGALAEWGAHPPGAAGAAKLLLAERLQTLVLNQAIVVLDLLQVAAQPRHLRRTHMSRGAQSGPAGD